MPCDGAWPIRFAAEAERLAQVLGAGEGALHHIGSTAVPGLAAKPIVDVLLVVEQLARLDAATDAFASAGYRARGENGIAGRRYFVRDDATGQRLAHVHAFEAGHPAIRRHLAVRDYLRAHAAEADAYAARKVALASVPGISAARYAEAKTPYVEALKERALRWDAAGRP